MERVWLVSQVAAWSLLLTEGLALAALLFVVGKIHLKRTAEAHALITDEGPDIHSPMTELSGRDLSGRVIRASDYLGRELAILLLSPGCAPCEDVLRASRATRQGLQFPPEFLVVMEASHLDAVAAVQANRAGLSFIMDPHAVIRAELGIDRTPYGLLIDRQGIVRMKGVVNHRGQLEGLIGRRGRHIRGMAWQSLGAVTQVATAGPANMRRQPEKEGEDGQLGSKTIHGYS